MFKKLIEGYIRHADEVSMNRSSTCSYWMSDKSWYIMPAYEEREKDVFSLQKRSGKT